MPGHIPSLDAATLAKLRRLVQQLHAHSSGSLPLNELVALARDVRMDAGVTIDFAASRELGNPMVVLRMPSTASASPALEKLSPRERQVAALVAEGLANKQIARRLAISLPTVKDHVHRILTKAGLPNRAAIAAAVGIAPATALRRRTRAGIS
jgi:DNA-binding NarL/FixJ family response regulator